MADYWSTHPGILGSLILLAFMLFPRVSLLFTVAATFAFGGWTVWLLLPSIGVAYHATVIYGDVNSVLVVVAWIWAAIKTIYALIRFVAMLA